jgi:hypothetical protein
MIIRCQACNKYFEDVFRSVMCPHDTFMANDGNNNFAKHEDSYLSQTAPSPDRIFEAHPEVTNDT